MIDHNCFGLEFFQKALHVAVHLRTPLIGKNKQIRAVGIFRILIHAGRTQDHNFFAAVRKFKRVNIIVDLIPAHLFEQANRRLRMRIGARRKKNGTDRRRVKHAMTTLENTYMNIAYVKAHVRFDGEHEENNDEYYNLAKYKSEIEGGKVLSVEVNPLCDVIIALDNEITIQILIQCSYAHYVEENEQYRFFKVSDDETENKKLPPHYVVYSKHIEIHG